MTEAARDYLDQTPADLIFIVNYVKHEFYSVDNKVNLRASLSVSLKEALLGFNKKIRTLDGRYIDID